MPKIERVVAPGDHCRQTKKSYAAAKREILPSTEHRTRVSTINVTCHTNRPGNDEGKLRQKNSSNA
ncbi:hypothetical protein ACFS07_33885 [Undibacterium arcticum]